VSNQKGLRSSTTSAQLNSEGPPRKLLDPPCPCCHDRDESHVIQIQAGGSIPAPMRKSCAALRSAFHGEGEGLPP
jgi:hypothetical protein